MEITYNLFAYHKLKIIIQKEKPDFIYERYAMYNFCGVLIAKRFNIPLVLEVNAPLYFEQLKYEKLIFKNLAKKTENWICNNATKTIVVSSALKDILLKQGVKEERLIIMSNGINANDFDINKKYSDIRKLYNIDANSIIIGVVGWFRKWHGLEFLIQTCYDHQLFSNFNIKLFFVGEGPAVPESKKLVNVLQLEKKVIFTGSVPRKDIPAYLSAIDIALQPRVTPYASPMKIIEYMALGKAIIAPQQKNIEDILTDGKDALLFEAENKNDLFEKIEYLIRNKEEMERIGKNALRTLQEKKLFWVDNALKSIELIENYL